MRIAMIGQKGMPAQYGGVEKHVHDLAMRLAINNDVYVYSRAWYSPKKINMYQGVHIIHTPTIHRKHLDTIVHTLISTLHALFQKYDVIHYHGVGPSLLSWIPRIFAPQTKVITTFHSIDRYHQKWGAFAKWILRIGERAACICAHETISVSHSIAHYCFNEYHASTHYIPNAVEIPQSTPLDDNLALFGLKKDSYFVMISRLVAHKGAHILIEAFCNLKTQHSNNPRVRDMKLAIVGGSAHTDTYVQQLHKQANHINDIVFTNFQSGETLEQLYAHAHAMVHPSLNEGLPITVLNAMSYEKAVLLSTIPEHIELTQDPRVLFKDNDVNALTDALYTYIMMSQTEKQAIAKENKKIVTENYSWDSVMPHIIKLYEKPYRKKNTQNALEHALNI